MDQGHCKKAQNMVLRLGHRLFMKRLPFPLITHKGERTGRTQADIGRTPFFATQTIKPCAKTVLRCNRGTEHPKNNIDLLTQNP
jgi:hypothetical protein